MIAYKFVIKKNKNYYSLMNYGIDRQIINCKPYKLNKWYNNPINYKTTSEGVGYHFFTEPNPKCNHQTYNTVQEWWNTFLSKKFKNIKIIIVKCKVKKFKIIKGRGYKTHIIANIFKIVEELK